MSCGLFSLFALLLVLVFAATRRALEKPDPEALLAEVFARTELPFGLEIVDSAAAPGGARMILLRDPSRYVDPESAPEPAVDPKAEPESAAVLDGETADSETVKLQVHEPVVGQPPHEVVVSRYDGPEPVAKLFTPSTKDMKEKIAEWYADPSTTFQAELGRGELLWQDLRTGYVCERKFARGGAFLEVVRVNLSVGDRYCVAFFKWPRDHAASIERIEEYLTAVGLRE